VASFVYLSSSAESAGTVRVAPGTWIQGEIDANPVGTTFQLGSGVHYNQTIKPKEGITIVGENGAVLDGQNQTTWAIQGDADNVTVRNLEVRNYSTDWYNGAIQMTDWIPNQVNASGWVLEDLNVHSNASHGLTLGDDTVLRNSHIHHNGMLGVGGYNMRRSEIVNNEINNNNTSGWDDADHGGGIKILEAKKTNISDNLVYDNQGTGIWCDIDCDDVIIERNTVTGHHGTGGSGIFYEISKNGVIRNNTITDCGRYATSWAWGAGVMVAGSNGVEIYGNTVTDCDTFVGLIQQDRKVNSANYSDNNEFARTDNISVTGNTFRSTTASQRSVVAVVEDMNDPSVFSRNFTFGSNIYEVPGHTTFMWAGTEVTWEQWQDRGFGGSVSSPSTPTAQQPGNELTPPVSEPLNRPSVTVIPIDTNYTNAELRTLDCAATAFGISRSEVQKSGVMFIAFIIGLGGLEGQVASVPDMSGSNTVKTTWTSSELAAMETVTARLSLSAGESQKMSGQVLSYLAGLSGCRSMG